MDMRVLPVQLPPQVSGLFSTKKKAVVTILVSILAIVFLVNIFNPLIVTVEGVGQVDAPPDSATVAFVVMSQKANAQEARDDVEKRATNLENSLVSFGATQENIAKSQVSVTPSGLTDASKAYTATVSMGGKVTNLDAVGGLVSYLYSNGAYYVSQPILSSSKVKDLNREAYDKALDDATSQVNDIAWKNKKLFRKKVSITKYSIGDTGSITKRAIASESEDLQTLSNTFTTTQVVTVVYKMW